MARTSALVSELKSKGDHMLNNAVLFLIIAIIAGVLGFGVVAGTAALIAKICFAIFLVMFVISLVSGRRRV